MKRVILPLVALTMVFTVGCASEKKSSNTSEAPPVVVVPDGPYVPPGNGPGQGPGQNWEYGGSAALTVDSLSVFSDYTGRPMNSPQNVRININLLKYGNAHGGVVTVTYKDNGIDYEGYFTSGNSESEARYNVWFVKDNKLAWHGFFSDFLGAIVVVIDGFVDLGDGGGLNDQASGSIWFKNFGVTYAPHPPTRCWFVSLGPYDCRAWRTKTGVETTRAVLPDSGYVRLGTFTGLNVKEAFNNQL